MTPPYLRPPVMAGRFYPGNPEQLTRTVDRFVADSGVNPAGAGVKCLIVPHAGYLYSGATAAGAFNRASGIQCDRVVLIGCSHHARFEGASIVTDGAFDTPVGPLRIDAELAEALAAQVGNYNASPHTPEHCIEVQLPFIALVLNAPPIVPILFGAPAGSWHRDFGEILAGLLGEHDLVVVTTDLSHYLNETDANRIDHDTIDTLLAGDIDELIARCEDGRCSMCSLAAVVVAMSCMQRTHATDWRLLDYRTSAHASHDTSRVVGYAAVSMEKH